MIIKIILIFNLYLKFIFLLFQNFDLRMNLLTNSSAFRIQDFDCCPQQKLFRFQTSHCFTVEYFQIDHLRITDFGSYFKILENHLEVNFKKTIGYWLVADFKKMRDYFRTRNCFIIVLKRN
jgi:hypothetical protein